MVYVWIFVVFYFFYIRDLLIHRDLSILTISFCDLFDFWKSGINNLNGMINNRSVVYCFSKDML